MTAALSPTESESRKSLNRQNSRPSKTVRFSFPLSLEVLSSMASHQLLSVPHFCLLSKVSSFHAPLLSTPGKLSLFHPTTCSPLQSSSTSRITNLQAVTNTRSEIESNAPTETTALTLRNICQGFVPEHILHRQALFFLFFRLKALFLHRQALFFVPR